jgi:ADP-ribosylglycohydrolase
MLIFMENILLFKKGYGYLLGGVIGDSMGAPVEGWHYRDIPHSMGRSATLLATVRMIRPSG